MFIIGGVNLLCLLYKGLPKQWSLLAAVEIMRTFRSAEGVEMIVCERGWHI